MPTNTPQVADDLDSFMAARRAQSVSQSSDEDSDDNLDAFMKARKAAGQSANENVSKTSIIPFSAVVPRTPLTTAAAQVGQPMIRLTPPPMDTTQVPLNVFTGAPQAPGMRTQEETAQTGTVSPSPQTVGTRVARALGSGAPQGSELANLTGQMGTPGSDIGPRVQNLMTESEQQQHPILTGGGEFASGMLTPESVLMLAGTGLAGRFVGPGATVLKKLLAAGFSAQMISDAASKVPDISSAIQRGDWYNAKRLMTHATLDAGMAGLAGHGMFDEPVPTEVPKGTISGPLAVDRAGAIYDDLQKQSRINAPVNVPPTTEAPTILQGRPAGPEPNPLETEAAQVREQQGNQQADAQAKNPPAFTVKDSRRVQPAGPEELPGQNGASKPQTSVSPLSPQVTGGKMPEGHIGPAQEPLAPESLATLKAQTDALANGTNPVVYFPKGTENIPAPPENSQVTVVPGDQPGAGTYYHSADVTPEQIHSAVDDGTFGKLLGYQQSKEEAFGGRAPAAITARDANGTEVKAALADVSNPQIVAAQAAEFARQFPDAKIGVENAESVIRERLGKGAPETPQPSEVPTPRATSRSEVQQGFAPRTDELNSLAEQTKTVDPALSEGLKQLTAGKYKTVGDLRKFIAESVSDPTAAKDLNQILDEHGVAGSAPRQLQPVIERRSMDFFVLARRLERSDPALAEGLSGMADGKYHTAADLQKFVDERIHDAKAKADLNKIVSDYRAATGEPGNAAGTTGGLRQVRGATPSVREVPTQGRNKLGVPGTRPKLEKANVSDFGRRQAQFFANLQRNPIEKEFAQSYLDARLNGKAEPKPIASLPAQRAAQLKSSIESRLATKQPATLAERFSPETISEAKAELQAAYEMSSSFEKPGRYHSELSTNAKEHDGAWYGVSSSRHIVGEQFPWFDKIKQGSDKIGELIQKGKGAEYERLLGDVSESIERQREAARPVIQEFAPVLKALSEELTRAIQTLAQKPWDRLRIAMVVDLRI